MFHKYIILLLTFFPFYLKSQNIDFYLTLIEKGKINEVRNNLSELFERYPENAGVYFLDALITDNGDSSVLKYEGIIEKYPNTKFASLSLMRIGEYLFARGLYSQASSRFKNALINYPEGDHHQRAMDLMVDSYFATGHSDSAKISLINIKNFYPSLNYDKYGIKGLDDISREAKLVRLDPLKISERIKSIKSKTRKTASLPKTISKPWVVQVGAFGKYSNATRLKKQLQGNGYSSEVHSVNSNGKRLHAVRVVRYSKRIDAENVGKKLKKKYGLDYRILNNPVR